MFYYFRLVARGLRKKMHRRKPRRKPRRGNSWSAKEGALTAQGEGSDRKMKTKLLRRQRQSEKVPAHEERMSRQLQELVLHHLALLDALPDQGCGGRRSGRLKLCLLGTARGGEHFMFVTNPKVFMTSDDITVYRIPSTVYV